MAPTPSRILPAYTVIQIAVPTYAGSYLLFDHSYPIAGSAEQALKQIAKKLSVTIWPHRSVMSPVLMRQLFFKLEVSLAEVSYPRHADTRAELPHEVTVTHKVMSGKLNDSFRNPSLLGDRRLLREFPGLAHTAVHRQTILFDYRINYKNIAFLVFGCLLVSFIVSIAVGITSKNLGYGIGCGGALFGLTSGVQALLFWVTK
ncbi:hypothetical protein BKA67DRAFT_537573 [Truncatella angustata]|uniref:Uncharacterized protein n=1 Tax=Truncatella angustata TaxID=152316 RepID=A0A9P8UGI2_9PEZI|nr:uncharacterized protein BKA67DRAFT_537573 [Truncatella angustata]KAH6651713.1 hypothetical protein BKA67DRAFT_537573 [Truncatella angustata]KAH8198094.1 hypothetical protein TruAng_007766 [Truncatella angustata]